MASKTTDDAMELKEKGKLHNKLKEIGSREWMNYT
jgi:hypothetical protein